jgi:Group XII secretory phospholipase A2 precursor (PLA2G12)
MLNRTTSPIAKCLSFGCIAVFSSTLFRIESSFAQALPVQFDISKLKSDVSKKGKSSEDVNRAMKSNFPQSAFPYYEGPNGCSNSPDSNWLNSGTGFKPACNTHDICYTTVGNTKDMCDQNFKNDMDRICATGTPVTGCSASARLYYNAVVSFGGDAYKTAQSQQRKYITSIYAWLK